MKLPTEQLYETVSQGIVALTKIDGRTPNKEKKCGEGRIFEPALREEIFNHFRPTSNLSDDPSIQALASIIGHGDLNEPIFAEKAIDALCYRSWYLNSEEPLSATLLERSPLQLATKSQRTVDRLGIPDDSVIDHVRFSHTVSGEPEDFKVEWSDLKCLTTGGKLHFPTDKLVYPSNLFKLDCVTGLTPIDKSREVICVPFLFLILSGGSSMRDIC